jgi:hypothetical protein
VQHEQRPKDPAKVLAGQARHRQLREQLGEEGYREYQRERRTDALRQHPDMQQRGGVSGNAAQLTAWGAAEYVEQRRRAFRACADKHGPDIARRRVTRATEARRCYRLDHPAGEAVVRAALEQLGFRLLLPREPFDYLAWRDDLGDGLAIDERTAVVEATVGRVIVDVLLPTQRVVIEADGGVHVLTVTNDERRRTMLEAQALRVITVPYDRTRSLDLNVAHRTLVDRLSALQVALPMSPVLS